MTISLVGFRVYRAAVQQLLSAAKLNPRSIPDHNIIAAWLAERPAAELVQQFERGHAGDSAR